MPRWPDIELDLSDIDLSLDIAYPVFNLSFYPVSLPDAPVPTISGFSIPGMPLLPRLPDLNVEIDIPVIRLPKLPDLPPPPKIPELSQAIQIVLKIFKIIVLIQCLYRKVPLSPEWVVGSKVAHKTERQGYLPFDFLDYRMPTVTTEWIDAIRVATHVKLEYDVDYITDTIRSALEPFTNFPRNLGGLFESSSSSTVDFNLNPDTGIEVDTTSSLQELPTLLGQLYNSDIAPSFSPQESQDRLTLAFSSLDISATKKTQLASIVNNKKSQLSIDINPVLEGFNKRLNIVRDSLALDLSDNKNIIHDIQLWQEGVKKPEQLAYIGSKLPENLHLTQSPSPVVSHFLALDSKILNPLVRNISSTLVPEVIPALPLAVTSISDTVEPKNIENKFSDKAPDLDSLQRTRGLYVTNASTTSRLIDYTEQLDGKTILYSIDDDNDGDKDVYYTL